MQNRQGLAGQITLRLGFILCFALTSFSSAWALNVTVTIPPLAGIIAPLLGEDDQIKVLLKPGVSPHGFQLRPSHLRTIQKSDLIIFVGGGLDAWIEKSMHSMDKRHVEMMRLSTVIKRPLREGGLWEQYHRDHFHADHSKKLPPPSVTHVDNHLWLSVDNAKALVQAVSQQLKQLAPLQTQAIELRTQAWLAKLNATDLQVKQLLSPVQSVPYLVLHDAFQYFEKHYQLNGVGTIRLNPELPPSLKRIAQLRARIQAGKVQCVFKEPQFSAKRLQAVISGSTVNIGILDPMMTHSKKSPPPLLYTDFLLNMAGSFLNCLNNPK